MRKGALSYDVHPGVRMMQEWIKGLKEKTGRSLVEWVALVRKEGPEGDAAKREWLKREHGLGANAAWWIVERARPGAEGDAFDGDPASYLEAAAGYVDRQYAGKKSALRPIFERLIKVGRGLGKDVRVCPCETIVPLYRNHVIAQVKASTNTRVDLGLALGKYRGRLPGRLIDTGGAAKKDRITHRIALSSVEEIDGDVGRWMKAAYDLDA